MELWLSVVDGLDMDASRTDSTWTEESVWFGGGVGFRSGGVVEEKAVGTRGIADCHCGKPSAYTLRIWSAERVVGELVGTTSSQENDRVSFSSLLARPPWDGEIVSACLVSSAPSAARHSICDSPFPLPSKAHRVHTRTAIASTRLPAAQSAWLADKDRVLCNGASDQIINSPATRHTPAAIASGMLEAEKARRPLQTAPGPIQINGDLACFICAPMEWSTEPPLK